MGRAMGRYSVTDEEKALTLQHAGWSQGDDGGWLRPGEARRPGGQWGQGYSLGRAFVIWRDEES